MQAILVFVLVIGGVVGFMYLLLKVCMWTSGSKATQVSEQPPAVSPKVDAAKAR